MKRLLPLTSALILPLLPSPSVQAEVVLADSQKALPIVIHPESEKTVRFAAEDLARILETMTGSRPEIRESTEPSGIVIGTVAQFNEFADDPGLAIKDVFDGREAYIIRPEEKANRVWFLGNREDGASHGVYSLLRDLGYRALLPGKNWEVIPRRDRVAVESASSGRPKVLTRLIWAGFGTFDKEQGEDVERWRQRNRLGASISGAIGHSWESMIRHRADAFEANPKLFAEKADGSVNKLSLRHGTQEAVDFTVDWFRSRLDTPKCPDVLSLAPTDGDNYSRDKETLARGDVSSSFYWYVNEVAKQMQKIAPDKLVGTTAYYQHAKPPPFDMEPNVLVLGATMFGSGGMTLEDFFTAWSQRCQILGIRDYIFSGYQFHADHPNGGYTKRTLERQAAWLRNFPIKYYSAEGLWEWGLRGMGYYALAQILWDPEQDVSALLKDFQTAAFGSGAEDMARYYETMEPTGTGVRKFQMARGIEALQAAAAQAKSDPAASARLRDMKIFLIHAALLDKARALKNDDPERWKLTAEDLAWNYRNRRNYMLNYNCNRRLWMVNQTFLQNYFTRNRNVFGLPDEPKPTTPEEQDAVIARVLGDQWRMEGGYIVPRDGAFSQDPVSPREIDEKFEALVVPEYPAIEVEETTFSTDYVPVDTGLALEDPQPQALWFGASAKFAAWRPQSDTLAWNVTPNVRYQDRIGPHDLEITLESPDGEASDMIRLKQDSKPKEVTIPLTGPGISRIQVNTKRMGMLLKSSDWEYLALPTDDRAVIFIGNLPRDSTDTPKALYFYVPKGVREIQAFANSPEGVIRYARLGPVDGTETFPQADGELIRIAVPDGQDGKVWSLSGGGTGPRFYFLNLPNIFSLHPGKLLLPRELVEKDGLKQSSL